MINEKELDKKNVDLVINTINDLAIKKEGCIKLKTGLKRTREMKRVKIRISAIIYSQIQIKKFKRSLIILI